MNRLRGQSVSPESQQADDSPAASASAATPSRLSGLRNLLLAKGIKTLHHTRETAEVPAQPEPAQEIADAQTPGAEMDYASTVRTFVPFPEPEPEVVSSPEHALTAEQEFLPPRPVGETADDEYTGKPDTARRDRRDTFDGVAILPSWRGQYRKKS